MIELIREAPRTLHLSQLLPTCSVGSDAWPPAMTSRIIWLNSSWLAAGGAPSAMSAASGSPISASYQSENSCRCVAPAGQPQEVLLGSFFPSSSSRAAEMQQEVQRPFQPGASSHRRLP